MVNKEIIVTANDTFKEHDEKRATIEDAILTLKGYVKTAQDATGQPEVALDVLDSLYKPYKDNDEKKAKCVEVLETMLGKFWMVERYLVGGGLYERFYIYPYKYVKENEMVFALYTPAGTNEYNTSSGLSEKSFHLSRLFDKPACFSPTTREDMLESAIQSCKDTMEYRIERERIKQTEAIQNEIPEIPKI